MGIDRKREGGRQKPSEGTCVEKGGGKGGIRERERGREAQRIERGRV